MDLAKHIFKWGLLLGFITSLATQILTWIGLGLTNWFIFLTYLLVLIFSIQGLNDLKKKSHLKFNYLNSIAFIFGMIIISRLIFQTYMFIYTRYIDPIWVNSVADSFSLTLQESNISADNINLRLEAFRKSYETLPMFTSSLILYAIPQFILGLITAGVYVFVNRKVK